MLLQCIIDCCQIWIGVPVFLMVFFCYCTIAPLTETTTDGVLANFDMVRLKPFNLECLRLKSSVQMESNLLGPWTTTLRPAIWLEEVL